MTTAGGSSGGGGGSGPSGSGPAVLLLHLANSSSKRKAEPSPTWTPSASKFFKPQQPVVHKGASGTWGFRYYDRDGTRKRAGGSNTKGEARQTADALIFKLRTGSRTVLCRPVGRATRC